MRKDQSSLIVLCKHAGLPFKGRFKVPNRQCNFSSTRVLLILFTEAGDFMASVTK